MFWVDERNLKIIRRLIRIEKEENSEKVVHRNQLQKCYRNENYGEVELPQQKELVRYVKEVEATIEEQYENEVYDVEENYRDESNNNYNVKSSQTSKRELVVHKRP